MANSASHALGAVLSFVALFAMLRLALEQTVWHMVGVGVFGVSLVLLYSVSALYHWSKVPSRKRFLWILDHCLIFVLIAGSYTPWLLVSLRGAWGWSLLVAVWLIAAVGIVLKTKFLPRFQLLGVFLYVAMGWLVCVALGPLREAVNQEGMKWLVTGGVFYTSGVVFYLLHRLPFNHLVWHLFVMAGSLCHVIAVVKGVLAA